MKVLERERLRFSLYELLAVRKNVQVVAKVPFSLPTGIVKADLDTARTE